MSEHQPTCLVCERSSQEVPLVALHFQQEQIYICPEHLPILIHHPDQLSGKLPGAENLKGHNPS